MLNPTEYESMELMALLTLNNACAVPKTCLKSSRNSELRVKCQSMLANTMGARRYARMLQENVLD